MTVANGTNLLHHSLMDETYGECINCDGLGDIPKLDGSREKCESCDGCGRIPVMVPEVQPIPDGNP